MYHAHFGLEKGLFDEGIAADTAVFRSAKHDRLIAHFKLALGSRSSVVVLRGPAGVGKTTLTSAALRMTSTRLALAWLDGTATNAAELLELILVELGMSTARTTRIERLQLWRQFQAETRATDSRLFIVVERAEDLAPEVLQALDQHTAPDAAGNPGASLVLLGSDGLDAHLAAPILASLRQRIRLRAELEPFTEAELQDYLRHQAACAGGTFDRIFAPGTVAALFRYSRGVARLANTLCESALHFAAVQQQKQLTADLVTKTAVSMLGLAEAAPATPAPIAAVVAPAPAVVAPAPVVVAPAAVVVTPAPAVSVVSAPAVERRLTPRPAPAAPAQPPEPRPAVALTPSVIAPVEPVPAQPLATALVSPPPAPPAAPPLAAPPPAVSPKSVTLEFDGGATDVTDVADVDFPVLTDAVDFPSVLPPRQLPPAAVKAPPAPVAPRAVGRLETAYSPAGPPKPAPSVAPTPAAAAPRTPAAAPPPPTKAPVAPASAAPPQKAAPPPAAVPSDSDLSDDDLLRQTQTLRAIAVAKSIDDISSSMAETLFGDAELDLMAAALASSAGELSDDVDLDSVKPISSTDETKIAKAPPKIDDDPFDLFDLGDDAPLELIDDSASPPAGEVRKTASR